ncbi:WAS/WASL-interacting protein family member 1-like [Pongo abelii]|uniref:WAS/WASL-interacting protein family member 1-like n=1 Tax=Pongo abelii TaxID=9601 RepID=UPI00300580A2
MWPGLPQRPCLAGFQVCLAFPPLCGARRQWPPGARPDIPVRLVVAPYGLKDTRSLHVLSRDVGATCGHTGCISDSPVSLFARVAGSRVGMPEPPGLGDEGRPLLHPGRREAVGSWVSAFVADSTPCGPGDLSVPQRDPLRPNALEPHSRSPGGIHHRIPRGVRTAQPAPRSSSSTGNRGGRANKEVLTTGLLWVRPRVSGRPLWWSSSHPPPPPPQRPAPPPRSPQPPPRRHFLKGPQPDSPESGGRGSRRRQCACASPQPPLRSQ